MNEHVEPAPHDRDDELTLGILGALLAAFGAGRGGRAGALVAVGGIALAGVALATRLERAARRGSAARRDVNLRTSLVVERPVHEAFGYVADFGHFPELMDALESVTDRGDGRSRWCVRVDGRVLAFDAMTTKWVPAQVIGWESLPNPHLRCQGLVRFTSLGPQRTRLDISLEFVSLGQATLREAIDAWRHPSATASAADSIARASRQVEAWDPTFEPAPPPPRLPRGR